MHVINGDLTVAGDITAEHISGRPQVRPPQIGPNIGNQILAQTAMAADSTDVSIQIAVTTGAEPLDGGLFSVQFGKRYQGNAPHVVFSPGNAAAALVGAYVSDVNGSGFVLSIAPRVPAASPVVPALAANTSYVWNFHVIGN